MAELTTKFVPVVLAKIADNFGMLKCFLASTHQGQHVCVMQKTPVSHSCDKVGESLMETSLSQGLFVNFSLIRDPFNFARWLATIVSLDGS